MTLRDDIIDQLKQQASTLSQPELDQLSQKIISQIGQHDTLQTIPLDELLPKIPPTIQVMLAQDHSSIDNAAQYAIQILVAQVDSDTRAKVPEQYQAAEYCPFPGLSAFDDASAQYYFGREAEIDTFIDSLDAPVTAITGASGIGKSSFLMAGVLPHLKSERPHKETQYVVFRDFGSSDLLSTFATVLVPNSPEKLVEAMGQEPQSLVNALWQAYGINDSHVTVVLDQFEGLFINDDAVRVSERDIFLDNLLAIHSHQYSPFITVILVTRENFYEHPAFLARPELDIILRRNSFVLRPLDPAQLRHAMEGPVFRFNHQFGTNLRFENNLTTVIANAFKHDASHSLPLVQYLLRLMWVEKKALTYQAYFGLGQLDKALDRHANDIYQTLPDNDKPLVKALLLALVRPGISGRYARKRVPAAKFLAGESVQERQVFESILGRFTNAQSRLISIQRVANIVYYELTHDILLEQWSTLTALIEANHVRLALRESLLPKAEAWWRSRQAKGPQGDRGELFVGNELQRAQEYLAQDQTPEGKDTTIAACYEASRRYRRQRIIRNSILALLLLIGFIATVMFLQSQTYEQGERAEQAEAQIDIAETQNAITQATATRQRIDSSATEAAVATRQVEAGATLSARSTEQAIAEATARAEENARATQEAIAAENSAIAESQSLANASELSLLNENYITALLLAIEAGYRSNSSAAFNILFDQLYQNDAPILNFHHGISLTDVRWNNAETLIYTVDFSDAIYVWDANSGSLISTLPHDNFIWDSQWSSSGQQILTANQDGHARIWDAYSGEIVQDFFHGGPGIELAKWSADESYIITDGYDGNFKVWDSDDGREISISGYPKILTGQWAPFGSQLLMTTDEKYVVIDIDTKDELLTFDREGDMRVLSAQWIPNGLLEIIYENNTWELWNTVESIKAEYLNLENDAQVLFWDTRRGLGLVQRGNLISEFRLDTGELRQLYEHNTRVSAAVWHPFAPYLLTKDENGVNIWHTTSGDLLFSITGNFNTAQWIPDGSMILTLSENKQTVQLWSLQAARGVVRYQHDVGVKEILWNQAGDRMLTITNEDAFVWDLKAINYHIPLDVHVNAGIRNAAISSSNSVLITSGGGVSLWDIHTLEQAGFDGVPFATLMQFNSSGKSILMVVNDGQGLYQVKNFNVETQEEQVTLNHDAPISMAEWSESGDTILTVSEEHAFVWQAVTGELLLNVGSDDNPIQYAAWDANEETLLTWGYDRSDNRDRIFSVWDGHDGQLLSSWVFSGGAVINWDPKTSLFIAYDRNGGQPKIWDADSQESIVTIPHERFVFDAQWNSSGTQVVTAGWDFTAKVWDVQTGDTIFSLGHDANVERARWVNNDTLILTISGDNTVHLWDSFSGDEVFFIRGDGSPIILADWDEVGEQLVLVTESGNIFKYPLSMVQVTSLACSKLARNFTFEEWQRYSNDIVYNPTCPNRPIPYFTLLALLNAGQIDPVEVYIEKVINGEITHILSALEWNEICLTGSNGGYADTFLMACNMATAMYRTR